MHHEPRTDPGIQLIAILLFHFRTHLECLAKHAIVVHEHILVQIEVFRLGQHQDAALYVVSDHFHLLHCRLGEAVVLAHVVCEELDRFPRDKGRHTDFGADCDKLRATMPGRELTKPLQTDTTLTGRKSTCSPFTMQYGFSVAMGTAEIRASRSPQFGSNGSKPSRTWTLGRLGGHLLEQLSPRICVHCVPACAHVGEDGLHVGGQEPSIELLHGLHRVLAG
ncbi:hypothetical protein BC830DRAFT_389250 [Chytriomyces sp. MP71]|nr:hypothetical protein BC830DRAFT_389250 [Chytriomyces sp. MP71]